MPKHWFFKALASAQPGWDKELGITPIAAQLLAQRGFSLETAKLYLNPELSQSFDPHAYTDMCETVALIRKNIESRGEIFIFGDYDVDGVTGASILHTTLADLGANVKTILPHRMKDGYGMSRAALDRNITEKTKLLIAVDNGITSLQEVEYLRSRGIDVVLVDHHQPKGSLPDALLISPLRCKAPFDTEDLAACGLAYKLCTALYGDESKSKQLLDLVALGTIADMAPMTGENRILVKQGLKIMQHSPRPGIAALLHSLKLIGEPIATYHVAFLLAPRINAAGRLGTAETSFDLLTTRDTIKAKNLAGVLNEENKQRQDIERRVTQEAKAMVEENAAIKNQNILVVASSGWHEGVMGIVAQRLVETYHKPAIAIALKEEIGKGSGRSLAGFNLFVAMSTCDSLFDKFGGHPAACGLTLQKTVIDQLRIQINENCKAEFENNDYTRRLTVDLEVPLQVFDNSFFRDMSLMEPFGIGNARPVFATKQLRVKSGIKTLKSNGYKFWVEDKVSNNKAEAITFRSEETPKPYGANSVDIVYIPKRNDWNGMSTLQLSIQDLAITKEGI